MTNSELLELAAKVAGAEINGCSYGESGREDLYGLPTETDEGFEYQPWRPLEDGDAALRLSIAANLEIYHADIDGEMYVHIGYCTPQSSRIRYTLEMHGDDPRAATCRAIVRAAAEIGRSIP